MKDCFISIHFLLGSWAFISSFWFYLLETIHKNRRNESGRCRRQIFIDILCAKCALLWDLRQNSKCRIYWCLIEFIDWRFNQSCWYFRPLLWTSAPLTFSMVHLPPHPPSLCVWISTGVHVFIQCVTGGRGPQTDKHLPPSTFTNRFLRKADI